MNWIFMNKQEIKKGIQSAFPTTVFDGNELDILINLFEIKYYKKNEIILRQGETSKGLYILKSGSVSVSIKLPGTLPDKIKLKGNNLFFGEVSLIEDSITTATVQAEKAACFFFLSTSQFQSLNIIFPELFIKLLNVIREVVLNRTYNNFKNIKKFSPELNKSSRHYNYQKTTMKTNFITIPFLRCIELFNVLNDKELSFLLHHMTVISLKKHSLLSNHKTSSTYFIVQGCIQCLLVNEQGFHQIMLMPPSGLIDFNILSYFKNEILFLTQEDSLLFCLDQKTINNIQIKYPSIYYRLLKLSMLSLTHLFIASNHKIAQLKSGHIHLL